ncbi:hypothetical protein ACQB6R_13640 [Propionibacteriaceae bacterium G1746]|uniref:hypothetical protein n=1 Tax=Aestuariimicrobium sp. G57 TaxID=3418485 RepID=UPI003C1AC63E
MADVQFNLASLDSSSKRMDAAVEDLVAKTQSLLGEVSDVTVLGTNDTLGSIASMLYGLAIQAVQESVASVQEEYGAHGGKLREAATQYAAAEQGFADASSRMVDL